MARTTGLERFEFRGLHPRVLVGTASDRYAGWIGQVYSPGRYEDRITGRSHRVGEHSYVERILPVESVEEYFDHFSVLEIDFTFYSFLLNPADEPTSAMHVLRQYRDHLRKEDRLILKVPQAITAPRLGRPGANPTYLDATTFTRRFYQVADQLLGEKLGGFVFEQGYQRKRERLEPSAMARALDEFFSAIPRDRRYHVELRTEHYLSEPVFDALEKHGAGLVFSHWTWLPPLREQLAKTGGRFSNRGRWCIIRLMTPIGMSYNDSYALAHPFDRLVEGMMKPGMVQDAAQLLRAAVERKATAILIVNNRAGGNAPLVARAVVQEFLKMES
jgi:uncharacterized protein YecE (DUF72 family)